FLWTVGDGQCWNTDTVQVTFLSDDISDLSVDAGPDQVLDIQSTTQLEGSSSGSSSLWTVIQGSAVFADATDPLTQVTGLGTGTNILVLTGSNGPCAERHDTLRVIVRDLFIPEGFSPNGDGVNDLFEITGISIYPDNTFQVFDRWGRPVFEE
ncbi:MAG: gliding motility-associated C-terminal domain-containing protein, partial [Flavobacteriales bacterium]|nr:gliding motility-associated C-terminal domain-containing protein [Flavobacteriales bacterium]